MHDHQPTPNLDAAIVAVRRKVTYIQKEEVKGLNYTVANVEKVIRELRDVLNEQGIVIRPLGFAPVEQESYETRNGGTMHRVRAVFRFRITHAASGEWDTIEVPGEAADTGDKCCHKAATMALKVVLLHTFLLERGDLDPETHEAECLGNTRQVFDMVVSRLRSARDQKDLDTVMTRARNRGFSDVQLQAIEDSYAMCAERLAKGKPPIANGQSRQPAGSR